MEYSNQNPYMENYNQYQEKEEEIKTEINTTIRLGFIRKVYGILTCQLLFTSLFCLCCMYSESLKLFLISNRGIYYLIVFLELVIMIVMICCRGITRSVPINYILLGLFTIAESYIVGFICSLTSPKIVFMAACMTCIMVIFLTIYAITSKTDITTKGSIVFLLSAALFCLVIFNFFFRMKILHVIICCLGVIIVGFYIIYDSQLIIGNKREMLQIDDYILGSFLIYTDIISLFLYLLSLFNSSSD